MISNINYSVDNIVILFTRHNFKGEGDLGIILVESIHVQDYIFYLFIFICKIKIVFYLPMMLTLMTDK